MRMIPKISVSPTPRKNSNAACDSALALSVTRNERNDTARPREASILVSHLVTGGRGLLAGEGSDDLRHRIRVPLLLHQLDDRAALDRLMVAFADRHRTLDVVDRDGLQGIAQGLRLSTFGLLDPRRED